MKIHGKEKKILQIKAANDVRERVFSYSINKSDVKHSANMRASFKEFKETIKLRVIKPGSKLFCNSRHMFSFSNTLLKTDIQI